MALTQEQRLKMQEVIDKKTGKTSPVLSAEDRQKMQMIVNQVKSKSTASASPKKKGFLEKAANVADATFGKAGNLLFGTTAKTIGSLVGSGVEAAADLAGIKNKHTFTKIADKELTGTNAIKNTAFTALELLPGGGSMARGLKGLTKGTKLAPYVEGATKAIPKLLKSKATKQYAEALAPTKAFLKKKTEKIVPELLNRRVTAFSNEGLLNRAKSELATAGDSLNDALKNVPKDLQVNTESVIKALDKMKEKAFVKGTKVIAEPNLVKSVDKVKEVINGLGQNVSFESLRSLRQIWDEAITSGGKNFGRTLAEDSLINIKRATNDAIRNELAKAAPDVAKINAEYTFWKNVEDIASNTAQRKVGQSGDLIAKGAQAVGAITGFSGATGIKSIASAALGAFTLKHLTKLTRSPGWRMISAVQKAKLADTISAGNPEKAIELMKRLLIVTNNVISGDANKQN